MELRKITAAITLSLVALTAQGSSQAAAKAIHITEMNAKIWEQFNSGETKELIVEFRQGDIVPLTIKTEGDLLETVGNNPSYLNVKRSFWTMLTASGDIFLSVDGVSYKDIKQSITGTFTAGASAADKSGVANGIQVALKAFLK